MFILEEDCPTDVKINQIIPNGFKFGEKMILADCLDFKNGNRVVFDQNNKKHLYYKRRGIKIEKHLCLTGQWDFRTHDKFSKRLYYAFYPLWWTLHQWDTLFANNFAPQLNFGFDTLTAYPDADFTLFENYDAPATETEQAGIGDPNANAWESQVFTVGATDHSISRVTLLAKRVGTLASHVVTVSIKAVDGSYHPTGADLASVTYDPVALSTSYTLTDFTFTTPVLLSANTLYAIVLRFTSGTPSSSNYVSLGGTANPGSGVANEKRHYSTDGGSSWNLAGSTWEYYVYGNITVDGRVSRYGVDETFATIWSSAGNSKNSASGLISLTASSTSNQYSGADRFPCLFNTSALTALATISAAVFSIKPSARNDGLSGAASANSAAVLCASSPAVNYALANADFNVASWGSTEFGRTQKQSLLTDDVYDDVSLNASGLAAISKTSITKFGLRYGWDFDNTTTGLTWASTGEQSMSFRTADTAGTSSDPKLVITYTTVSGPANRKTWNGITSANIKTFNGIATANQKTYNGIT